MVAVNTSDLSARLPDLLARVRRGETVQLVENGEPIARITSEPKPADPPPAADEDDGDDDRLLRGVYAPELPRKPIPGFLFPAGPTVLERRPIEPNLNFLPPHESDDE